MERENWISPRRDLQGFSEAQAGSGMTSKAEADSLTEH